MAIVNLKDEVERVKKAQLATKEKLRRMTKVYVDGLFPDEEYNRQKNLLQMELESLVVPQANAAASAGKLLKDLPKLWVSANQEERRRLLLTMVDAVYFDTKKNKSIIAVRPKPPFRPLFQVAVNREGADIRIEKGLPESVSGSPSVFLVEAGEG